MSKLVCRFDRRNISVFISCQPSFSGAVPPHESSSRHHHRSRKRPTNRCVPSKPTICISASAYSVSTEEADACAKQVAAIIDGDPRPVPFTVASAVIRRTLTDPPPCHCRTKEVYTNTFFWPADCRAASTLPHAQV